MEDILKLNHQSRGPIGKKFRALCAPIESILDLSGVTLYSTTKSGSFRLLSTRPEWHEFHIKSGLFFECPFYRDPKFFDNGFAFSTAIGDPEWTAMENAMHEAFPDFTPNMLLAIKKYGNQLIACGLGASQKHSMLNNQNFINQMPLIKRITEYLINESTPLMAQLKPFEVNLKKHLGNEFKNGKRLVYSSPVLTPKQIETLEALEIMPAGSTKLQKLSKRELECAKLALDHLSVVQVAERLALSSRTVEHYFETIKLKLGCSKKGELMRLLSDLRSYGAI